MGLIAFEIGGVPVYTYGLIVLCAVLVGAGVAYLSLRFHGERTGRLLDLLLFGLPLALVCGRLAFVLCHCALFRGHWGEIFALTHGGFSLYGCIAGLFLAVLGYSLVHGIGVWHWLDLLVPAFLLALSLYELGMFWMQMTLGEPLPADLPNDHRLAEYVEFCYRPAACRDVLYFEPIALYEAGMQFGAFLLVTVLAALDAHVHHLRAGVLFLIGALLVAGIRFGCGFFYQNSETGVPLGQILSGGAVLACLICLFFRLRARRSF